MITQLSIENFGLIDKLSLEFGASLNILTGETGAGKSIIIDALRFCLGEPLNQSQIRTAALPSVVEIVFDIAAAKELRANPLVGEFLADSEAELIIHRAQYADGRKKIKINGRSVTISQLRELGNYLVDFHGAHDHQLILSQELHLSILDRLTDFAELKGEYRERFRKYKEVTDKIDAISLARVSRERECDLLSHQLKELEQLPLEQQAYDQMRQKQLQLNNAEKLYAYVNELVELFENEDTGIGRMISRAFIPARQLIRIDEAGERFEENLNLIQTQAKELAAGLIAYRDGLSFEPEEARLINNNCDMYEDILRKYGPTFEEARKLYQQAKSRQEMLVNLEHNDAALRREFSGLEKELDTLAVKMTRLRKKTADFLKETIETELSELGIKHARFECRLEKIILGAEGADNAVFYLSPNAGEELKPLAEIVSSGEAARLMLALKKALTKVDTVPVLIFDEIDAQIGGRLGSVTGRKLKELALNRQVILITHLPQIASFADKHFHVSKKVQDKRTIIIVDILEQEGRIKELAKMMSGEKESRISLEHAQDMLLAAKKR